LRLDRLEARRRIVDVHRQTAGNTSRAAPLLGVSRRQLTRYIRELLLLPTLRRMREEMFGRIQNKPL